MQYLKVIKAIFEELTPCPWPKIPTSGGSLSNPSERCRRMMVEYITDSNFDQKPRPEDFHYASQSNVSRGRRRGNNLSNSKFGRFFAASTLSFSGEQVLDGNVRNLITFCCYNKLTPGHSICYCLLI